MIAPARDSSSTNRKSRKELTRRMLYDLLGDLPNEIQAPEAVLLSTEDHGNYTLEHLTLSLNGIEEVPAFFVRPNTEGTDGGKYSAVLYFHSHGGHYDLGKRELTEGIEYMANPPYAEVFGSLGIAALCIDQWGFGARHRESESALFKKLLWEGKSLYGMMMYDSLRALDYLSARPDVRSDRIATLGMSMGSTHAWWVAAFDERVSLCIDICCLTDYQSLLASGNIDAHALYYFVPGLLKYFTTASINSLISPRRHLSVAGQFDPLTPQNGLDVVDRELSAVYRAEGVPENWTLERFECAHEEIPAMRQRIVRELEIWVGRA